MDKEKEIIKKVIAIPLEEWHLLVEEKKYNRFKTTLNGLVVWLWVRHEMCPSIEINGLNLIDNDLIRPLMHRLEEFTKAKKEKEREVKINEVFNKVTL